MGSQRGTCAGRRIRVEESSITVSSASATAPSSSRMSTSKSAFDAISTVSCIMSSWTFRTSPSDHSESMRSVYSAMTGAYRSSILG